MSVHEVLSKWIGKRYQELPQYWHQCVAWVKKFVQEMWRPSLWRFWGVWAYQWRINNNKTFWPEYKRVEYWTPAYPVAGDIIIFKPTKNNPHWHIGIVTSAWTNDVLVVQQNWETGNWTWLWLDAIVAKYYGYGNVAWRYHYTGKEEVDPDIQWLIDDWIFNGNYEPMDYKRLIKIIGKLYNKVK